MKNSKLIKLLRLFDTTETKQLKKFVQGMSGDEAHISLFKFLLKQAPQFDYQKEQCFKAVYPDKAYSDATLRKLFAKGIQLTEQFIQWNKLQQSDLLKNRLLTSFYEEKEATTLWEKQLQSWEKVNQKAEWNQQFKENLAIAECRYNYSSLVKDKVLNYKNKRAQVDAFSQVLEMLEKFIIRHVLFLKINSKTIFNLDIRKEEFNFVVLEKLVDSILSLEESVRQDYWEAHTGILVAWKTYLMIDVFDHSQYLDLKQLTTENKEYVTKKDQLDIINNLLHYCYIHHEKQGVKLPHDAFKFYKLILERKFCYKDGYLVPTAYYSLCNLAYILKETDWFKWFLEHHTKDLPAEEQFHYFHYFHGLLSFQTEDFKASLKDYEALEQANSYLYNFDAKVRVLMACYEVESDRFLDAVNSCRVMLSRNSKAPEKRIQDYKLFVNYLYQVYNTPIGNKEKLSILKQKIETTDFSVPKTWLLEKLQEKIG